MVDDIGLKMCRVKGLRVKRMVPMMGFHGVSPMVFCGECGVCNDEPHAMFSYGFPNNKK